ncbi:hypothetical protein ZIOFF_051309 [Zingiber officinale]|uniref:Uncharacterized protein n=1 Tax=Zingiber officinale TaxID=94328 RepID=A0A8J5FKB2_ZINOF|nr:hypothetical protein ZIOFF_051309 [Zingiber officinale]
MSSDFFDIVLPNPVFSVDKAGLGLRRSPASAVTGLWFSETTGKEILLFELEGTTGSDFKFDWTVSAIPCRALPADRGRSGNFVLRFGGTSLGKSGRSIGRTGARGRGLGELGREDVGVNGARGRLGELGREEDAEFTSGRGRGLGELGREEVVEDGMRLILDGSLPTEGERPAAVGADGVAREMVCLVGVDGRELDEDITEADLAFTGVDERVGTERDVSTGIFPEEGVTGRLTGVDGLEVTEAELVFRTEASMHQRVDNRSTPVVFFGAENWIKPTRGPELCLRPMHFDLPLGSFHMHAINTEMKRDINSIPLIKMGRMHMVSDWHFPDSEASQKDAKICKLSIRGKGGPLKELKA